MYDHVMDMARIVGPFILAIEVCWLTLGLASLDNKLLVDRHTHALALFITRNEDGHTSTLLYTHSRLLV